MNFVHNNKLVICVCIDAQRREYRWYIYRLMCISFANLPYFLDSPRPIPYVLELPPRGAHLFLILLVWGQFKGTCNVI